MNSRVHSFSTHFKGLSSRFSANARKALSSGPCTVAQARSNSIKLCAHFDAMSSSPDLHSKKVANFSFEN